MNTMSKIVFGLIIIIGSFTSCSSDDSDEASDGNLVGTWIGVSSSINGVDLGVPANNIVQFSANNRVEFIYEGFGINGQDISEVGDWSLNGNTLTITWDVADPGLRNYVLTITELTENSLKWETVISGEGTLKESFNRE
jgi:hypothetical protein